jgi:phage-related protein
MLSSGGTMKIIFYEDKKGFSEVENFITELDNKSNSSKEARIILKRIIYYIELLEKLGTRAGEKIVKHLEDEIWELRPGDYRITFFTNNDYILLTCFRKKTNKTPKREIEKAKKYMNDWLNRNQ